MAERSTKVKTSTNKHGGKILADRERERKKREREPIRWSKFSAAAAHFWESPR